MHQFFFFLMPLQILMILGQFITLASKLNNCLNQWIQKPYLQFASLIKFQPILLFMNMYSWICWSKLHPLSYPFTLYIQYLHQMWSNKPKVHNKNLHSNSFHKLKQLIFHLIKKTYIVNCLSNKCFFNLAHCLPFAKLCIRLKLKIKNV